jgi:YD repeat-containing protein
MYTRRWRHAALALSRGLGLALSLLGVTAPAAMSPPAELTAIALPDALVATGPTTPAQERALRRAVAAFGRRTDPDDFTSLTGFLAAHPHSPWRIAVLTNLGIDYRHYGYFSRALAVWAEAWREGKDLDDSRIRPLVDLAVGELAELHAALGHERRLAALLQEIGKRPIGGPATAMVLQARQSLWIMRHDPKHLLLCGPTALKMLLLARGASLRQVNFLTWIRGHRKGTSLAELAQLARRAKLPYVPVFRTPGEPVPVPAIMHFKVGHFAAIVGRAHGRFHLLDPSFGRQGLWITRAALDSEASGYFLAPARAVNAAGWRMVETREAGAIWGAGYTTGPQPGGFSQGPKANPPRSCGGMCTYNISELDAGLSLSDTPVGYAPQLGPSARVSLTYNQYEDSQPASFTFFNLGPRWTLNWLSYIEDDPTQPGANVTRYLPGGGAYAYSGYSSATGDFTPQENDASVLQLVSTNPIVYKRFLNDGSVEVYAASNGATTYPRYVFLTQVIDPQGNAVSLTYDNQMRLTALTDATGRQTTFTYGSSLSPLLITRITDPFGRSATLAYNSSGQLSAITDVLGLTSSFSYDASGMIDALTTPYGTTSFAYGATGTGRYLDITDPLGLHEREETAQGLSQVPFSDPAVPQGMATFNQYLNYRDSFYWDKHAYVVAGCTVSGGCNYADARLTHFHHDVNNINIEWHSVESRKYPLENRVWYNYPGQPQPYYNGTYDQPTAIGRVLSDGSTQLWQFAYSSFGKVTKVVDPTGRETDFAYAANGIDLTTVTQQTGTGPQTIASFTYNSQHRPLTYTDAAGQTTSYAYNAAGQLTSVTNALNQTTSYQYDSLGRLTAIINADGKTQASFTYDPFDRVATFTDSEGWSASYSYDAGDRVTQISYPDGTTRQYTYSNLDLASFTDRQGHTWTYSHDADRRLTAVSDPLGDQTQYGYYENGALASLTDPDGHATRWDIDLESRPIAKHYADGTSVTYGYDGARNLLVATTDALGQSKQYSYTPDNRLAGISYVNAINPTPNVTFSYDPAFPRIVAMSDGTGTTSYSYVPVGSLGALQLYQDTSPLANSTITYGYDALGRVVSRSIGEAGTQTFSYDALGRLVGHSDGLGQFTISYLGETGQITERQLVGGTITRTWSYLPNSGDRRLAAINDGVRQYLFTTTPEGLITALSEEDGAGGLLESWSYGYDNADRLTSAVSSNGTQFTLTLDPAGNITATGSASLLYNTLNELTSASNVPGCCSYDADGNLVADGTRTYSWDAENRLVGITQGNTQITLSYDGAWPARLAEGGGVGQYRRLCLRAVVRGHLVPAALQQRRAGAQVLSRGRVHRRRVGKILLRSRPARHAAGCRRSR